MISYFMDRFDLLTSGNFLVAAYPLFLSFLIHPFLNLGKKITGKMPVKTLMLSITSF